MRPVERARALRDLLSGEAASSERLGRLTDSAASAILEANLFSVLVPKADGGLGGTRVDLFETVEEVARSDGSAGWSLSVCAAMNDFVSRGATEAAKREVLGSGPAAVWTSLGPFAKSVPTDGGFRVSGAFRMGSGSAVADWLQVSETLPPREGRAWLRAYLVPKAEVTLAPDSWDVMGLRATASLDYTLDEAFVPAHRTFEYPGQPDPAAGSVSTLYGIRLNQIGLAAFASGVGLRARDELVAAAAQTSRVNGVDSQAQDHHVQYLLGELDGRLRAARAYMLGLLADQDAHMARHGWPDAAITDDTSQAAQVLAYGAREMVVFAFDYAGSGVIYARHPLQRCLRDIFAGLKHAAFTPYVLTRAGKARLNEAGQA